MSALREASQVLASLVRGEDKDEVQNKATKPKYESHSDEQREMIVHMWVNNLMTAREISEFFKGKVPIKTVYDILRTFHVERRISKKSKGGREAI